MTNNAPNHPSAQNVRAVYNDGSNRMHAVLAEALRIQNANDSAMNSALAELDIELAAAQTALCNLARLVQNNGAAPDQARAVVAASDEVTRLERQGRDAAAHGDTQGVNDVVAALARIADTNPGSATPPTTTPVAAPTVPPEPEPAPSTQPAQDWMDYVPRGADGQPVRAASETSVTDLGVRVERLENERTTTTDQADSPMRFGALFWVSLALGVIAWIILGISTGWWSGPTVVTGAITVVLTAGFGLLWLTQWLGGRPSQG